MPQILQLAAVAAVALGTGFATISGMNQDMPDLDVPAMNWVSDAALDGRVFYTQDHVVESGETMQDELHFANGLFQSAMCQTYCDFGWSEYQTSTEDGAIHFTAVTKCPDAPHTVVFYGTVIGDEVTLAGTWTTRRWYWTRQMNVRGTGTERPPPASAAAG